MFIGKLRRFQYSNQAAKSIVIDSPLGILPKPLFLTALSVIAPTARSHCLVFTRTGSEARQSIEAAVHGVHGKGSGPNPPRLKPLPSRRMIDRTRSKLVSLVSPPTALRFIKSFLANERELGPEILFRDLAIVELLGKIQPT